MIVTVRKATGVSIRNLRGESQCGVNEVRRADWWDACAKGSA